MAAGRLCVQAIRPKGTTTLARKERENTFETRCVARLEAEDGLALKLVLLGLRGFMDRTCMRRGRVCFVEFKRTDGSGVYARQQAYWRGVLEGLGFAVFVVESDAEFDAVMEYLRCG